MSYAFVQVATKREQKAASVLERSVKCLNKRAIILTRSGISGVFLPSKISPSLSFFLPFISFSVFPLFGSSVRSSRSVCLFSSRLSGPCRRCRRPRGPHVKSTRHVFHSLPAFSSGSPLYPADSDRQPFPAFFRVVLPNVAVARGDGVALATRRRLRFRSQTNKIVVPQLYLM